MNKAIVRSHRIMGMGIPYTLYSPLSFDDLSKLFGKNYLGEVCNVTGLLKANVKPFIMLESTSNLITGEAMYDPIHEEVFGESNLAESPVPPTVSGKPSVWTDLLGAIDIFAEHFQSELTPQAAQACTEPTSTEDLTLTPRNRSDIERLLYNAEIQYPESEEFLVVRGGGSFSLYESLQEMGYEGSVDEFLDGLLIKPTGPTVNTYREAAAGNRPFPIPDSLATALATLPEIKGVNLKDSSTHRDVMNEAKDLLNDPTAHGTAIVDTILSLLGIENKVLNLLDQVNLPKPKQFTITPYSEEVYKVFLRFLDRTAEQAKEQSLSARSPNLQLELYAESRRSLERRTYIAFGDLMQLQGIRHRFIVDNAEADVFNLSIQFSDAVQRVCTVRYSNFEYTMEIHR